MENEHIYSVSELNHEAKHLLEQSFGNIWLEGEISNFLCHTSGHWYFSLKDADSEIRAAMFRMHNQKADIFPENGMHVRVKATVSIYPNRGAYQLIVGAIEEVGDGLLQKRFEALKKKLDEEKLFDASFKQPLPRMPNTIGVVTSPTGAAIKDILSVLKRRYPVARVIIYPTLVQGTTAHEHIAQAIEKADQRQECDVLIIARGGGSIEDLWPFNEEKVARAIFACRIPTVSGVGHEIDITITDFVVDHRAATPSAAAECVSPHIDDIRAQVTLRLTQISTSITRRLQQKTQQLTWLSKRLKQCHPLQRLLQQTQTLDQLTTRLQRAMQQTLKDKHHHLKTLSARLHSISPLATLSRGYAIVTKTGNPSPVKIANTLLPGDNVEVILHEGKLTCEVKKTVANAGSQ